MRLRLTGMTAGLAGGVTAAVALATASGAYLYSIHHFQSMLDSMRSTAMDHGQLMRVALEHQMMEKDRSLIERMVRGFGNTERVEKVMILDRTGHVRYANDAAEIETVLRIDSPTCQACHRLPAAERAQSQVIETRQGTLLRTVIPLFNRQECHACHDPQHRINGVLIVDHDAGEMKAAMNRDLRWMAAGSAVLALLLVAALALVLRLVVTRRLQRFETTARRIAEGDLEQRVPVKGSDTLAWLGREFNMMADTMTGLIREVGNQREQLETVLNGIDDGIVVLDVERNIVAANDAFLRRSGRSRESVLGSSCHDSVTGVCGVGDCPTAGCLNSDRSQIRICKRRTPGGREVWEEVHASPIRRGSEIVQVVEVWRDISERRAAEAHLAESHRLASLGMLASGFSHELNTPLGTTLTCVESIQRTLRRAGDEATGDAGRIAESAAIAREQLLRCRGITRHFLRLARGQEAGADVIGLESCLAAVKRLVEPTARSYGVEICLIEIPTDLHVRVNEASLQHVLLNLLMNAIQASERGGTVRISVKVDDAVRIRVSDDGVGISAEDQKHIFEPFFSGRRGGTGLGLFLSRDFVRAWGGEIRVESNRGAGSTLEVEIPSVDSDTLRVVH